MMCHFYVWQGVILFQGSFGLTAPGQIRKWQLRLEAFAQIHPKSQLPLLGWEVLFSYSCFSHLWIHQTQLAVQVIFDLQTQLNPKFPLLIKAVVK